LDPNELLEIEQIAECKEFMWCLTEKVCIAT